jgi:hypothetical protein
MTVNEPVFKAFDDFGIDDMPACTGRNFSAHAQATRTHR